MNEIKESDKYLKFAEECAKDGLFVFTHYFIERAKKSLAEEGVPEYDIKLYFTRILNILERNASETYLKFARKQLREGDKDRAIYFLSHAKNLAYNSAILRKIKDTEKTLESRV